jgi:hypothetical protein
MATLSVAADGIAVASRTIGRSGTVPGCLAEQLLAAVDGFGVADGEFVLVPRAGEVTVGVAEVDHCARQA